MFLGGYRRVGGSDEFVLISTWDSEEDATQGTGGSGQLRAASVLADVATIESLDSYRMVPPLFKGILDQPGAVIRLSSAVLKPGMHDALYRWLDQKEREIRATRLLLGWALGERVVGGQTELMAVSAWPSPLLIEALAEPGRQGMPLFAEVEQFISDAVVTQYQAIELQLPARLSDVASRRIVAARFDSEEAAGRAREAISVACVSANEAGISVAKLASDAVRRVGAPERHVMVARVSLADYPHAERTIADHGGLVILAADEKAPQNASV